MACTMNNEDHQELNSNQRKNIFLLILWLPRHGVAVNNACHCAVHCNCGFIVGDHFATITTTVEQVSRDFSGRSGYSSRESSREDCRAVNFC